MQTSNKTSDETSNTDKSKNSEREKNKIEELKTNLQALTPMNNKKEPQRLLQPVLKPHLNSIGRPVNLITNYFKIETSTANGQFYKYAIKFEPMIPDDSIKQRRKIIFQVKDQIEKVYGTFYYLNTMIYSMKNIKEEKSFNSELENQTYKISIIWTMQLPEISNEMMPVYKKFFFNCLDKKQFIAFKKCFLTKIKQRVDNSNLEIWTGFIPTVNQINGNIYVNIDLVSKVLRKDSALNAIENISNRLSRNQNKLIETVKHQFIGSSVYTPYNNDKLYIISDVDFQKNPTDTFLYDGKEISFIQYFKDKYGKNITDKRQPLLISKKNKTNENIYLIPELCFMTGLSDDILKDFKQMKEITKITLGHPSKKTEDWKNLIKNITKSDKYKKSSNISKLKINVNPVEIKGRKLEPGLIELSNNYKINISKEQNLDRAIQNSFYSSQNLHNWGIIFPKDFREYNQFLNNFKKTSDNFRFLINKPMFQIGIHNSRNFDEWKDNLQKVGGINNLQFILCILSGKSSKNGDCYKEIKSFCSTKLGVPTQMVLQKTLSSSRNIYSIICKIVIQINAKLSGSPWIISNISLSRELTMIVSFNTSANIISSLATFDKNFSQYFVKTDKYESESDCRCKMISHLENFFLKFVNKYKNPPRIIIYREKDTKNRSIITFDEEVNEIIRYIHDNKQSIKFKFTYILLNKRHNLKFALKEGEKTSNPLPGTLVDDIIIDNNNYEFYLVSQNSRQGLAQATYYKVLYDDNRLDPNDLHSLTFQLSYLYYNFVGSVKVPAPQYYAKKLSSMINDVFLPVSNKSNRDNKENESVLPSDNLQSLFFI